MANRAQRRQMARSQQKYNSLIKNGITLNDLNDAYHRGMCEGFKQAGMSVLKSCYAAIILALHETFGFDDEECYKAIVAADAKMLYSIEHAELADKVFDEIGLRLNFNEAFDRVERTSDG